VFSPLCGARKMRGLQLRHQKERGRQKGESLSPSSSEWTVTWCCSPEAHSPPGSPGQAESQRSSEQPSSPRLQAAQRSCCWRQAGASC
jgi:hypothetical protein